MNRPVRATDLRRKPPDRPQKPPNEDVLEFVRQLAIRAADRDHELEQRRQAKAAARK